MSSDYNKPEALEYIFNRKYDPDNPQPEILFTRDDVRKMVINYSIVRERPPLAGASESL